MKMKPGRLITAAMSIALFAVSGLAMARSLTPADYGVLDKGYNLPTHNLAPVNWNIFESTVEAKTGKRGKSHPKGYLFWANGNPAINFCLPEIMPGNAGMNHGRPDHIRPVNPPVDMQAIYNGLVNAPALMPPSVPSNTLPGSGFGHAVVPVPAAVWLFVSGLFGMIGMARRHKQ